MKVSKTHQHTDLRIGIDGEALRIPMSGVGHYVYNLCLELEKLCPNAAFFVYTRHGSSNHKLPSERWQVRQEPVTWLRKVPSFAWLKMFAPRLIKEDKLTHFWGGRSLLPPLPSHIKSMVTVHDLNHLLVPHTMERITLISHRLWLARDVKRADVVMTNSHGTATRLKHHLNIDTDLVVHPGLSDSFLACLAEEVNHPSKINDLFGFDAPYILSVATLEPRKNVELLFRAFLELKSEGHLSDFRLVLVGARGWKNEQLEKEIREAAPLGVVMAGYLADEKLPAAYRHARLLACPSIYEGFGMPVREAWACGTPTLVSNIPELKEAAGGHACLLDTLDIDSVKRGLLAGVEQRNLQALPDVTQMKWKQVAKDLVPILNNPQ